MAVKCAENYQFLRKKRITARKTNDVIIASFCIDKGLGLLYFDRDFMSLTEYLGLRPVYIGDLISKQP